MNDRQENLMQWMTMSLVMIAVMLFWLTMVLAKVLEKMP